MDTNTIIILVGFGGIVIERIFSWAMKIKKSKCLGGEVEMKEEKNNN